MTPNNKVERTIQDKLSFTAGPNLRDRMLRRALQAHKESKTTDAAHAEPTRRSIIMRSPITKLAVAAAIILAVALGIVALQESTPVASAADVFSQAALAMHELTSFHVNVKMRTPPGDNFSTIGLDYKFVPIDFWRQYTDTSDQWRLEEPGRVVVMDGQVSTMLMKFNNQIHQVKDLSPERYWKECLVELDKVMDREATAATEHETGFVVSTDQGDDGREKIVVTVEAQAKVPEDDYLRNKYIENSNHMKVYVFDAETSLLEELEIYVHDGDRDVLVFQVVEVQYDVTLDPALFTLDIPENAIFTKALEILPDNERYETMTPKEAATAFFTACSQENWDELLKFLGQTDVSQRFKDYLGGLEVIEIGEPFQSGRYPGWFIPYKIKLKGGYVKEHNLALRNDNPAKRFMLDGGI